MKIIYSLMFLLFTLNSFAQGNYNLQLFQHKITKEVNFKQDLSLHQTINFSVKDKQKDARSYVLQNKKNQTSTINFCSEKRGCKPGMMLLVAPVVGLWAGYGAYEDFKDGDKSGGYMGVGIASFLIIAPVSYIIYCNKHGWH